MTAFWSKFTLVMTSALPAGMVYTRFRPAGVPTATMVSAGLASATWTCPARVVFSPASTASFPDLLTAARFALWPPSIRMSALPLRS